MHHHRVRCDGQTTAGKRCTVTSSSQHMHADPLRRGNDFVRTTGQTSLLIRLLRSRMSSLRMNVPRAGSGAAHVEWSGSTGPAAAKMAKR